MAHWLDLVRDLVEEATRSAIRREGANTMGLEDSGSKYARGDVRRRAERREGDGRAAKVVFPRGAAVPNHRPGIPPRSSSRRCVAPENSCRRRKKLGSSGRRDEQLNAVGFTRDLRSRSTRRPGTIAPKNPYLPREK